MRDYGEATRDGEEDWQKRMLAHQSLSAIIGLMDRLNMPAGLDRGFTRLHEALWEIDRGNKVQWLESAQGGRPPISGRAVLLRARVAAVMEYLMKNETKREAAAKFVFRTLAPSVAAGLGAKGWGSIAGWRDALTGSVEPERHEEVEGFQKTLAQLTAQPGAVQQRAKIMLQAISKATHDTFGKTHSV